MHCIKCRPNLRDDDDDEAKTMQQTSSAVRRGFTYSFVQRSDAIVNSSKALCLQKHSAPFNSLPPLSLLSHLSSALETYFTATSKIMNTDNMLPFRNEGFSFHEQVFHFVCRKNANCQIEFDTKAVRTAFFFFFFLFKFCDSYRCIS